MLFNQLMVLFEISSHEKITKCYHKKQTKSLYEDSIPIMKLLKQLRKQKMYGISVDRSFHQLFLPQVEMIIQTRLSMIKRRITSNQITQKKPEKMLIVEVHDSSLENLVWQARGPSRKD